MKTNTAAEFTAIIYSRDGQTKKLIKSICKQNGVKLIDAKIKTNLIANSYSIAFIDKELLDEELIGSMNKMSEFIKMNEWKIIILGGAPDYIPSPLRLYSKVLTNPKKEFLTKIIERKTSVKPGIKAEVFKTRIHRIIYLYHYAQNNFTLAKNQLCATLGVTERTLFRDLKILRELFPDQNFHLEREYK